MKRTLEAIHFPVRIDGARGQLRKETDYPAYVAQLIRQVLLTAPGERAHRPDFGCGLRRMVFAPTDDSTAALLQTTIFESLNRWLSDLISVDSVEVTVSHAELLVKVVYTLRARGERQVLNLEVTQ